MGDGDLGRTSVLRHKIDTGDAAPIHQPARRLPFHQRGLVQNMIRECSIRVLWSQLKMHGRLLLYLQRNRTGRTGFALIFAV